eukprot:6485597-Amphidinium_carterae.1
MLYILSLEPPPLIHGIRSQQWRDDRLDLIRASKTWQDKQLRHNISLRHDSSCWSLHAEYTPCQASLIIPEVLRRKGSGYFSELCAVITGCNSCCTPSAREQPQAAAGKEPTMQLPHSLKEVPTAAFVAMFVELGFRVSGPIR